MIDNDRSGWLKPRKIVFAFGLGLAIVVVVYVGYRNFRMDQLYYEAAGYPQYFHGFGQSTVAVRRLATYQGPRATGLLLEIALGHTPLVWSDTRSEAIRALADRNDPVVGQAISNLLQPFRGLDTRSAAAKALLQLPCQEMCIRSILEYLDRIWLGEPNYEDLTIRPPDFSDVTASVKKRQQAVYEDLYSVLRQRRDQTIEQLVKAYGLGTDDPSPFALD